jgi:hypothetical protein
MTKQEIDDAWEALSKEQLGSFLDDVRAKGAAEAEADNAELRATLQAVRQLADLKGWGYAATIISRCDEALDGAKREPE